MDKVKLFKLFSERGGLETNEIIIDTVVTEGNDLPSNVVVGRDLYTQLGTIHENLSDLLKEEIEKGKEVEVSRRKGKNGPFELVKSKYPIDLKIFPYFVNAVSQNLSNQSYASGNCKDENNRLCLRGEKATLSSASNQVVGNISKSLRGFICDVFGTDKPNQRQQRQVIGLLRALQDTFVSFTDGKGQRVTSSLCYFSFSRDGDNAPQILHLTLPPIWSETLKGIGRLPQNINYDLTDKLGKRKTPEHMELINHLCIQDKREPVKRNVETLVKALHLTEYYTKDKKKVEDKIVTMLNDLKEIGYIEKFICEVAKKNGRNTLSGVQIFLPQK